MRVVIYGVGRVGTKITETLSEEKHDVTVIGDNEKNDEIQKSLDVLCIPSSSCKNNIKHSDADRKIRDIYCYFAVLARFLGKLKLSPIIF